MPAVLVLVAAVLVAAVLVAGGGRPADRLTDKRLEEREVVRIFSLASLLPPVAPLGVARSILA